MTGNTITEFIESLYSNCDKEFTYKNRRYMLQGWVNSDNSYSLQMSEISSDSPIVFASRNMDRAICVEEFEKSELFDGRTIYEADNDITVLYD